MLFTFVFLLLQVSCSFDNSKESQDDSDLGPTDHDLFWANGIFHNDRSHSRTKSTPTPLLIRQSNSITPNIENDCVLTSIQEALSKRNINLALLCLRDSNRETDVYQVNNHYQTLVDEILTFRNEYPELLESIFEQKSFDVNKYFDGRITLLHYAIMENDEPLMLTLFDRFFDSIDVNKRSVMGFLPFEMTLGNLSLSKSFVKYAPNFNENAKSGFGNSFTDEINEIKALL